MSGNAGSQSNGANGWLFSAPALILLLIAASGPLVIVVIYSFL